MANMQFMDFLNTHHYAQIKSLNTHKKKQHRRILVFNVKIIAEYFY